MRRRYAAVYVLAATAVMLASAVSTMAMGWTK